MTALLAGLPVTVPGTTVNRLCGSSLDAVIAASRAVASGDLDLVLVGGVESMSRAPWVVPKPGRAYPTADQPMVSTTLGWRLVNPRMPAEWTVSLGEATEQLGESLGLSRDRADAWAARSQQRAAEAWAAGRYDGSVVDVPGTSLERDESIRATDTATLATLRPAFRPPGAGTITAGNASPMSDGAGAGFVGSARAADLLGTPPLARIAGRAATALEPHRFGLGPVEAAERALRAAGVGWDQVGAVELNEAFAAQTLACIDAWPVDEEIVNAWGGAIAIGHPLGASGLRVVATLAERMRHESARWGVAALCIGVGQGLAVVLENEDAR